MTITLSTALGDFLYAMMTTCSGLIIVALLCLVAIVGIGVAAFALVCMAMGRSFREATPWGRAARKAENQFPPDGPPTL